MLSRGYLPWLGESDKPAWGLSVARLAADLKDFIDALQLERPVVVGTSLGCAVIWAYVELYAAAHAATYATTHAAAHAAAHAASALAAASPPDLASEVRRRHVYTYIYMQVRRGLLG